MKLIPHHQDDKAGRREYRSPDGTWRVVRPCRRGGNERPRWEVHERHEDHAGWHCRAAFERRRDALVFLDTTAATPGGESTAVTTMAPKQRETPEHSAEPPPPSPRRTPRRPITHYIDETRTRGGPRLERPRLSAPAASNLDVATGPPGAAGLPDVRARARCSRRTRPVSPGGETFNLPPPTHDLLHDHDLGVPPRRSLAGSYCMRLGRNERVPAGLGCELVQLLRQVPLALVLPRQQPVLIKLAGAGLTQNPLGKRFLQGRLRRNADRCAAHFRSA